MLVTKNLYFTFVLLFTVTFGQSQIVTSKKEAVKKGIYQKPAVSETKNDVAMVDKIATKNSKKSRK